MDSQEGFGKKLAEHPIVVIITLLASCIAIFVFVTNIPSFRDVIRNLQPHISNNISQSTINDILGAGNWFCFPDRQDAIGIKNIPPDFVVKSPFESIDTGNGKHKEGERVDGSGTAWLYFQLPLSECPSEQQAALNNWLAQRSTPVTQELINSEIGAGNWNCTDANYNVIIKRFPSKWVIRYPFTSADINGGKFGVGDTVSGGTSGTLNMVNMPREQCP
jgi:hypothetical protein